MSDGILTLEDCQEFAKTHGYKLTKYAEKIIARTNANGGYCPCKSEEYRNLHPENDYQCPCSICVQDVKEMGHCCCNLYTTSEND